MSTLNGRIALPHAESELESVEYPPNHWHTGNLIHERRKHKKEFKAYLQRKYGDMIEKILEFYCKT